MASISFNWGLTLTNKSIIRLFFFVLGLFSLCLHLSIRADMRGSQWDSCLELLCPNRRHTRRTPFDLHILGSVK
jgi:hypothetical protein